VKRVPASVAIGDPKRRLLHPAQQGSGRDADCLRRLIDIPLCQEGGDCFLLLEELLALELQDLDAADFDLDLTGFSPGEIDGLLSRDPRTPAE
jgi:hypothetical protein